MIQDEHDFIERFEGLPPTWRDRWKGMSYRAITTEIGFDHPLMDRKIPVKSHEGAQFLTQFWLAILDHIL